MGISSSMWKATLKEDFTYKGLPCPYLLNYWLYEVDQDNRNNLTANQWFKGIYGAKKNHVENGYINR
jgi:hypothetical protein